MSMNRQAIFEKVVKHLFQQKTRAYKAGVGCAYRGTRGKTCAVGCLIKDRDYIKDIEGIAVGISGDKSQKVKTVLESSLGVSLDSRDLLLLGDLQYIHDSYFPQNKRGFASLKASIKEHVEDIASTYSLDAAFVRKL